MANESVAHDPALSSDEEEFLRLWRLLDPTQKAQTFAELIPAGRSALYRALDLGGAGDLPMDRGRARTETGAEVLRLVESAEPDEAAQILALLHHRQKAKQASGAPVASEAAQ